MKLIKKYWFKAFCIVIIVLLSVYVCGFAIKKALDHEIYKQPTVETKIYTVWHIETFEGGGKSRIDYLKKIARSLEKENDGVLFMIRQISPEKLETELMSSMPDIVSFGFGLGKVLLPNLINFEGTYDVRDDLIKSGTFNNKLYAIPYIVSGYALITHGVDTDDFHCGTTNYTKPSMVYASLNKTISKTETQYEAYKTFVNNKNTILLGTGRDVFRVNNLNNIGRTNARITPVDSYTDLIQYIGKTKTDENIEMFISEVFSDENQNSLVDYSLFSSKHTKLYHSGIYNNMENAILTCEIANVFDD